MKEKLQNLINYAYRDDFTSLQNLLNQEPLIFFYNHHIIKQEKFLLEYLCLHFFSYYRLNPKSKKEIAISEIINKNIQFLIDNDIYNTEIYIDGILIQGNLLIYNLSKAIMLFNDVVENSIEDDLIVKLMELGDPNTIISYENKEEVLLFSLIYHSSLDFKYIKPFFNQYIDPDLLERKDNSLVFFDPSKERYLTLSGVLFENLQYREKDLSSILELLIILFQKKSKINNPYNNIEDYNIYKLFKFSKGIKGSNSDNSTILNFLIKNIEKNYGRGIWQSIKPEDLKILSSLNPDLYLKWFSFR